MGLYTNLDKMLIFGLHFVLRISAWIFGLIFSCLSNRWLQVVLKFLQEYSINAPFLVLHCSYCTLMPFLMILPVVSLSVLMILLSTLSVSRHIICGSCNWYENGYVCSWRIIFNDAWTVFYFKLVWGSYIVFIAKKAWCVLWSFFLLRLLIVFINLPHTLYWILLLCLGWWS